MNDQREIQKLANSWIISDDTGISSKTIWSVMMGVDIDRPDIPYDPSDFGRCFRLLELIPSWKYRLSEVSNKYPSWNKLVENWNILEKLWLEESPFGSCPKLYNFMRELEEQT